jgi:methylated-DNA-[protein]-cysteine S-methyltransferase
MEALLRGEPRSLMDIELDLEDVPPFECDVYRIARTIPPGATLTYGEVARRLGKPDAAREVGVALGRNPFPLIVPCHRVIAAGGKLGGFSAHGGRTTKRRLLAIEGARADPGPDLFDRRNPLSPAEENG